MNEDYYKQLLDERTSHAYKQLGEIEQLRARVAELETNILLVTIDRDGYKNSYNALALLMQNIAKIANEAAAQEEQ